MREVTEAEYAHFIARHKTVSVGQQAIRLLGYQRPSRLQPDDFKTETTTLWSFPKRGNWATHKASYRGNWAPQIARNIISDTLRACEEIPAHPWSTAEVKEIMDETTAWREP